MKTDRQTHSRQTSTARARASSSPLSGVVRGAVAGSEALEAGAAAARLVTHALAGALEVLLGAALHLGDVHDVAVG